MNRNTFNPNISNADNLDITKKMLDTIRNKPNFLIKEDENVSNEYETAPNTGASQSEDLDENSFRAEKKSFMDTVSAKVDFRSFKIYRKERNVVFSGKMQDLSGLEWVMSLRSEDGLNITVQSLKIDNDSIAILNKLNGFYNNWSKTWAEKINTSYQYNA